MSTYQYKEVRQYNIYIYMHVINMHHIIKAQDAQYITIYYSNLQHILQYIPKNNSSTIDYHIVIMISNVSVCFYKVSHCSWAPHNASSSRQLSSNAMASHLSDGTFWPAPSCARRTNGTTRAESWWLVSIYIFFFTRIESRRLCGHARKSHRSIRQPNLYKLYTGW